MRSSEEHCILQTDVSKLESILLCSHKYQNINSYECDIKNKYYEQNI